MRKQPLKNGQLLACPVAGLLLSLVCTVQGETGGEAGQRLQELLAGEVLYHYHQKDYFSAISKLQKEMDGELPRQNDADTEILMARLRLAYGLHGQAEAALKKLRDGERADGAANLAWYELARSLFHKGRPSAAQKALKNVKGEVPKGITGDLQLLRANVLSALGQYAAAAQLLARWRGSDELAPYAHYNRGIALRRAGDQPAAIDALRRVADMSAERAEMLALKDKANLTLGYILLQRGELEQAQAHLNKVRLRGPFSNQALLTAGMVSQMKGHGQEALVPWMALRERMLSDPAVQESLLAVPYMQHQLNSPKTAALQYEQAVTSLSLELRQLNDAMQSVNGSQLLTRKTAPEGTEHAAAAARPASRYLGDLLASRVFQETSRDHNDLRSMLGSIAQELNSVDRLGQAMQPALPAAKRPPGSDRAVRPPRAAQPIVKQPPQPSAAVPPSTSAETDETVATWQGARQTGPSSLGIPLLPEVELPPEEALASLPGSTANGLPGAAEDIGLPPAPEEIGLPLASGGQGLPPAPEDIGLPPGSSWRKFDRDDGDPHYTERLARYEQRAAPSRRLLRRILRPGRQQDFTADSIPMGKGLGELAAGLGHTTNRLAELSRKLKAAGIHSKMLRDRIAALRARILRLRNRIEVALTRYEEFARSLAMAELRRRQGQLESYLEYARLELAKSYDSADD
jgi:predicted negative regulator of RcsB-dependent stress response